MKTIDLLVSSVEKRAGSVKNYISNYIEYRKAKRIVDKYEKSSKQYTSLGIELLPHNIIEAQLTIVLYENKD